MGHHTTMSRTRTILAVATAALMVAAAGVAVVGLGIGTAAATADGDTYASVTELRGASYNGQVDEIVVTSTGYVAWENLPEDADHIEVTMQVNSGPDKSWQTFAEGTFDDVPSEQSGEYSYDEVSGEVLANTDWTSDDFSSDGDGEIQKRYFPVKVIITVVDEDGNTCTFEQVHKVKTYVENIPDPDADGDTDIGGEIIMDDDDDCLVCGDGYLNDGR